MDKKTWIVIAISCGIVALAVAAVLVCLLFILPSYQETDAQKEAYQAIDQSKYTFSDKDKKIDKDPDPIVYKVTNDDLVDGVKTDKFDEGNIFVDGISVKENPLACKQIMAYIPDNPDLYEYLTGIQYLNFIADIYGVSSADREQRIREEATAFELEAALGDLISSMP